MTERPDVRVRVTRRFDAPAQRVFDAWLNPEQVRRWMAACGSMKNLARVAIDPHVGGTFAFVDVRAGEEVEHVGEYLEIERPRRLVFTWLVKPETSGSRVAIDVVPDGDDACEATLTHELAPEWADFADRCEAAWARMLGGIAAAVA